MLRIAHIVRRFSFDQWGVLEEKIWRRAQALRDRGVISEIVCTSALSISGEEERDGICIRRFGYRYPYFPLGRGASKALDKDGGNPWCPELVAWLRQGTYDLFHIYSDGRLAKMAVKLAHERGIPSFMDLRDGIMDVNYGEIKQFRTPLRWRLHYGGLLDRFLKYRLDVIDSCDLVLCSNHTDEVALAARYPKQWLVCLPGGIASNMLAHQATVSARAIWKIPPERKIALMVGRLDYAESRSQMADFLHRVPGVQVVFVGPDMSSRHRALLQKLLGDDAYRLTLIAGLSPCTQQALSLLHEASAMVLPSRHEGFSHAVLAAWSASLPVIAATTDVTGGVLEDGVNGLLYGSEGVDGMVNCWQRLEQNASLAEQLKEAGRHSVENFTWENLTYQLIGLYEEAILRKNSKMVMHGVYG